MKISVMADGDGFLVKVNDDVIETFAWGETEEEAIEELILVVEAISDIHEEEVRKTKIAKKMLLNREFSYAV